MLILNANYSREKAIRVYYKLVMGKSGVMMLAVGHFVKIRVGVSFALSHHVIPDIFDGKSKIKKGL
jgi:hypothetical protein